MTLKLKTARLPILTRAPARWRARPSSPAGSSRPAATCSASEIDGTRYRLLGIGVCELTDPDAADRGDLIDRSAARRAAAERAVDRVRGKFGQEAMLRGLAFDEE